MSQQFGNSVFCKSCNFIEQTQENQCIHNGSDGVRDRIHIVLKIRLECRQERYVHESACTIIDCTNRNANQQNAVGEAIFILNIRIARANPVTRGDKDKITKERKIGFGVGKYKITEELTKQAEAAC